MLNHFVPRVARRLGLAQHLNQSASINVSGKTFRLPLIGLMGYGNLGLSEPWMTQMLAGIQPIFDRPQCVFVDVGVNIGQTLLKLRSVAPNMDYVGFEPNPACVHYTTELIRANNFDKVTLYPFGISNQAQVLELQFYSEGDLDSSASLVEGFRPDQKVVKRLHVPTFPYSSVKIEGRVSLLKIDVEGGEWDVIQGMAEMIERDLPIISMEILPAYNEGNHDRIRRQQSIETMLRNLGYSCNRVLIGDDDQFKGLQSLSQIEIHGEIKKSEYLWVPMQLQSEVESRVELT
jgi:FkbM family methyltransferase